MGEIKRYLQGKLTGNIYISNADAESKPWTTQSLVREHAKSQAMQSLVLNHAIARSQATRSLTQAVVQRFQGIVVLRDLGAQVNSGCSWVSA